jgi:hypothetical protein
MNTKNKNIVLNTFMFCILIFNSCSRSSTRYLGYSYFDNTNNLLVLEIPLNHSKLKGDIKNITDIKDYIMFFEYGDDYNKLSNQIYFKTYSNNGSGLGNNWNKYYDKSSKTNYYLKDYFIRSDKLLITISNDNKKIKDIKSVLIYFHLENKKNMLLRNTDTIMLYPRQPQLRKVGTLCGK